MSESCSSCAGTGTASYGGLCGACHGTGKRNYRTPLIDDFMTALDVFIREKCLEAMNHHNASTYQARVELEKSLAILLAAEPPKES